MATTAAPQGTILKQANEHPNFTSVAHVGHNCMGIIIQQIKARLEKELAAMTAK